MDKRKSRFSRFRSGNVEFGTEHPGDMTLRCASRDHVPQSKQRAKYDARSASAVLLRINMRQSVSARSQAHSWPRVWQVIDGSRPSVVEFATLRNCSQLVFTKRLRATLDNIEPAARPQLSPGFNAVGERSHVLR